MPELGNPPAGDGAWWFIQRETLGPIYAYLVFAKTAVVAAAKIGWKLDPSVTLPWGHFYSFDEAVAHVKRETAWHVAPCEFYALGVDGIVELV